MTLLNDVSTIVITRRPFTLHVLYGRIDIDRRR